MTTKKRTTKSLPRNLVMKDGLMWFSRAGQLWGDYKTAAEYIGCMPSSFPCYVWRHNLKTIKHGRKSLVSKQELDEKTGALMGATGPSVQFEYLPIRGRQRRRARMR